MSERIDNHGRRLRPWPHNPTYLVREDGVILHPRRGQVTVSRANGNYLSVSIDGRTYPVARVVCETFHGPAPSPGMQAAHEDGDKRNNCAGNLSWKTRIENAADKVRHGTHLQGSNIPWAKLTEEKVRAIREHHAQGISSHELAKRYEVSDHTIRMALQGKTWGHVR